MNNEYEKARAAEPFAELNERAWQAWIIKGREADRRAAVVKRRFLAGLAAVATVAAAVYTYLR